MAENSSLSRWTEQAVVKDVRFNLSLDDPMLPQERWVQLKGDRTQLEELHQAVSTYVQTFLEQPQDFLSPSTTAIDQLGSHGVAVAAPVTPTNPTSDRQDSNGADIFFQSSGLLGHDLNLGSLATAESGSVIHLTTLQLFDLATALDEYSADLLELPPLPKAGWFKGSNNWAQIAAIAVAVVGLSASMLKLLDNSVAPTSVASTSAGTSSNDQRMATQIAPSVSDQATPAIISPERLPSIPPLGTSPPRGLPSVMTPTPSPKETTTPSLPSSKTLPQNSIATFPITGIPDRPTVILGEKNPSLDSQQPAAANGESLPSQLNSDIAAASAESIGRSPVSRSAAKGGDRASSATAFDTIPQVAEVRSYFQQRWKPPEGLTQTLEYTLLIDPNGSIQSIVPLRQQSGDYIDRTGMPLVGETFVSPLATGRNAKIRLVLGNDGKVQAFLEQN
jgi:hypothetical protein